jgi:hypothetical protein
MNSTQKEENVKLLRQKLDICKINYTIARLKLEKIFEEVYIGLTQEYYYRKIVMRQIELYKEAVKNAKNFDVFDKIVLEQKLKLIKLTNIYIKYRDQTYLKNAEIAITEDDNAKAELIHCMYELLDNILDMVGDQGDSMMDEIKSIFLI